jgi:cell wall-associated NlpC family hydrolase
VFKRRAFAYGAVTLCAALVVGLASAGTAAAVPPPPPNPSDTDLSSSRADANSKAGQVGQLTNQLAQAEAKLMDLQADVEVKMEAANKARVDMQTAQDAATKAAADATAARKDADLAGKDVEESRKQLDDFAAGSFKQGSTTSSTMSAVLGASGPEDLLARSQLLDSISASENDMIEALERASIVQANKDSLARAALELAKAKQAQAEQAKRDADTATAAAEQAQQDQATHNQQLQAAKEDVERQLIQAQEKVSDLVNQRQRYLDWLAAKQREDEQRARQVTAGGVGGGPRPTGNAQSVINRALAQLGMPYAWGGGDRNGPTYGIRDGGVADYFGDYRKIGFDCSGLMVYAFAGAGVSLPHYSGYQATSGRRVPLSQMQPGDLLFWQYAGIIHHVALYIGNGQMIEAPYSGARVRIAAVRYGGIVPYATRVL